MENLTSVAQHKKQPNQLHRNNDKDDDDNSRKRKFT